MIQFLLIAIFICAAMSMLSYIYCWQDVKSGRPHIISLRQVTSIMDRERLTRWLGPPQPGYFYALSPEQLQDIMRRRAWFIYAECALDGLCIFGAWWYSDSDAPESAVLGFLALAGLAQAVNLCYSFFLIRKWKHQLREELDNSED